MEPLISVIVPVFNGEKYIGGCLESILCQSCRELEILVIDDGSADRTVPQCEKLKALDGRILIHSIPHGGVSEARNYGLSVASGKYVAFVDSDDRIAPDLMENLLQAMGRADADVGFCRYMRTASYTDRFCPKAYDGTLEALDPETMLRELIRGEKYESHVWAKLYRRDLFKGISFPKDKIYEDMFTTYQVVERAKKGVFIDYTGYCYVNRKDSLTGGSFQKADLFYPESAAAVVRFCKEKYPALSETAVRAYYRALFRTCKKYWKSRRFDKESTVYLKNALGAYEAEAGCLKGKYRLALFYVKARIGFLRMVT